MYNYFKNMGEENVSQELKLKNIDETRIHLIEEINGNELMSKKHKKVCTTLIYIEHFVILGFAVTGSISISDLSPLLVIQAGITSSAIGFKICAVTAGIKKYKSVIKKHDKIVPLTDSVISYDKIFLIDIVLKEYNKMKKEIKNLKT